jgi:hypothetical protein
MTYVIGEQKMSYQIPGWTTIPDYCASYLVLSEQALIMGANNVVAATFDGTFIHVHYTSALDLAGTQVEGITYSVSITVQLHGQPSVATIDITFQSPCLNMMITADLELI